jgi:hypothetical protein
MMSDEEAWRTYVVDSDGRRLTPALVGPAADFIHPDSPGSLASLALPGDMELEHAPTGIRIIIPHGSPAEPFEDYHRLEQLPGVLRAAADLLDPPRRGPRVGAGLRELRFEITMMWLTTGRPPKQTDLADRLNTDASSISRASRSGFSIRGGSGWDNQLVVAASYLRWLQAQLPSPKPDEPADVRRKRELLNRIDLTGF